MSTQATSDEARRVVPSVEHEHVQHINLLKQRPPLLRLNDGPFRFLHACAALAFVYCAILSLSNPEAADVVDNAALDLETEVAEPFEEDADPFDEPADEALDASVPLQAPEMWEPKTPQDYVKVVWAVITVAHALVNLFCVWMVRFKVYCQYSRASGLSAASHVLCVPRANHGVAGISAIVRRENKQGKLIEFDFRRVRFQYDAESDTFSPLRFPDSEPVRHYLTTKGFKSEQDVLAALEKWGANQVQVPAPKFMELMKEQVLAPFFCFQVFCVLLWCLDEYWYYSLFTLFMLVLFESTVVFQRQRSLADLRAIQVPKQHVQVFRGGKWSKIPGEMLLPGDVFSVVAAHATAGLKNEDDAVMPADALLVSGTCVVDEAVLTGESTPQWKEPIAGGSAAAAASERRVDVKLDKLHMLFGGTKVVDASAGARGASPGASGLMCPDGGALAVVLRTGYETAQGRLMRTILFSTERLTANTVETGLFICFLLVFAVSAAGYVLYHGLQEPPEERSRFKLYLNCAMVITSVIPPELPMELTMAVNNSLLALRKKSIFCTEPFRIPYAGKVEVCCFDKTGTLTSDNMLLRGLAALRRADGGDAEAAGATGGGVSAALVPADAASTWPQEGTLVLACCHSLIILEGELIGDPLERAAFESTSWTLASTRGVTYVTGSFQQRTTRVMTVAKFHFSSELKRMSVIVKVEVLHASDAPRYFVLSKGAPEVMRHFLADAPGDYVSTYRWHASQGSRVIALACKELHNVSGEGSLKRMAREEVEQGLAFQALAVFQTPLKEGSEPALRMLAQSSHQLVMITGDAPLTACHVAREVHIVDRDVLILTCDMAGATTSGEPDVDPSDEHFSWRSPDDTVVKPFQCSKAAIVDLAIDFDLCVTGDGLAHCCKASVDDAVIACTQVFARVSPDQKEHVLKAHRAAGRTTLMCGDGTNDVGALKAAHVGIALMEPPKPERVAEAREAAVAHLRKRQADAQERARNALRGLPPPPRKTRDANGELLPGSKLLAQFEDAGKPVPESMRQWAEWLDKQAEEGDGMPPTLKPGDASMASPFTVKAMDVLPTTDILKQGRCTLVITLQMFKILGLMCLSTAYSLSVLYLAGVKLGDIQATCQGMLSAGLFYFVANAKPQDVLSPARPHQSVFSSYVMTSILAQFAIQISFIIYMYNRACSLMPEDDKLTADADFRPTLVNTVCFLVQNAMQLITFAVNYVGEPFQTRLTDNKGMISSIRSSTLALALLASGFLPQFTSYVQLVDMPLELKSELFMGCIVVAALSAAVERWLRAAFPAFQPPRKGYESVLHMLPPERLQV